MTVQSLEERRLLSVAPVGTEFRANSFTAAAQSLASVARDGDGDFVISWTSSGQDGNATGIFAQRYDLAGVPQGTEFRVNTFTAGEQSGSSVAMDADGDFTIAWTSYYQDGDRSGVFAQRYNAVGAPQGGEFRVNTTTSGPQLFPSAAMAPDGQFVITWQSASGQLGGDIDVYAQRYNGAGVPQGGEFLVNTFTDDNQLDPQVAIDATGDFVVVWTSNYQDGSRYGVFAQRYNAAGLPQGSEFQVNSFTAGQQFRSSVAMDADGDFVIAWQSGYLGNPYSSNIYAQRYDAAGVPQGGQYQINTFTSNSQTAPSVAMDADGNFVIAWESRDQDGSERGVYAQAFSPVGVPQGGELRVNTFTVGNQRFPNVAMDAGGNAVIAWQSDGQDGSGYGVYVQRFAELVVPDVLVIDNSDAAGFALSGDWGPGSGPGVGRNNNVNVAFGQSNTATDVATWTFDLGEPGRYRVSATWFTNTGFPHLFTTAARYEVSDAGLGAVRGTAIINQQQVPNDFNADGSTWDDLGVFEILGSTLQVRLTGTPDDRTYTVADAIRIEKLADSPTAAEIQVTESGFDVADNSGNVSFGAAELMTPIARTFEISNLGSQTLQLTLPVTVPAGFTLTSPPALTALAPGQSTTFIVRLDAALPGAYSGPVSFANSDGDENPFNFNVAGTVLASRILDDGQPGYAHNGLFTSGATSVNRDGDVSYAVGGPATPSQATWTFNVPPGQYRVAATWFANSTHWASNAPFTVLDGATPLATVPINQRQPPDDFIDAGSTWEYVGDVFNISGSTLTVQLSNVGADGYVIADAVRIERIGDLNGNSEAPGSNAAIAPLASKSHSEEDSANTSSAEELLTTAYWTDDLDDVVTAVAEAITSRDSDNLADDPAANGQTIQTAHEPLDLALADWQV